MDLGRDTGRITRRAFLGGASGMALGLATGGLLGGCANTTTPTTVGPSAETGPGGIPLARPDHPVTLPRYDDNEAIASGLGAERGPLRVYNWQDYINPTVIKSFERTYKVKVQVTTFDSVDESIAKLASGAVQFDVAFPAMYAIPRLVAGKLIQPLNLDYVPNLKANVWPWLANPWYDSGSRYTVPYGLVATGIAWRADKLPNFDPSTLANPYDCFWQAGRYKGKVGMLDDERDVLGWALERSGVKDVNTGDPGLIARARDDVARLVGEVNLKFAVNEYETLPAGSTWLNQSWSGNMVLAQYFLPKGVKVDTLRYWWPGGTTVNDTIVVVRGAKNPVLAHLFLNHLLDSATAVENFSYIGFQQPVAGSEPDALVKAGLVPVNLRDTLLTEAQVRGAKVYAPLSQRVSLLWQDAWSQVKAAV
jgi:spermidine/putrescine transport system substrate-binding protein